MDEDQRARLARCERHGLAYDPAKSSGCVLCQGHASRAGGFPPLDRVMTGLLVAIVALLGGGIALHLALPAFEHVLGSTAPPAPSALAPAARAGEPAEATARAADPRAAESDGVLSPVERHPSRHELPQAASGGALLKSGTFTLRARNAIGRSGTVFIPPEAEQGPRPLLVLFHGTGGSGAQMVATFAGLASRRAVVVLAPDSGRSPDGNYNWQVPDRPGDTSLDMDHVRACLDELYATEHLRIDPAHVLAAGHSGGGSSAAYQATSDGRFQAFAVLHGGVFAKGLGGAHPPAWFSTGTDDTLRPPAVVERAAEATRAHGSAVTIKIFPGGHALSADEIEALVAWWLDG